MRKEIAEKTNQVLIQKVVKLVHDERRIGVEILELLLEIERRKAYTDLGYDGLFSFCVKELKYSEAQAMRRIQAMRAMKEIPALKEKIQSGALTVTTVSQVQTHLRKQKQKGELISKEQKLDLFTSMQNQSAKEVEKNLELLGGKSPSTKLILELDDQMNELWTEIKNLSAHSTGGDSVAILSMLMREWLKRNDPKRNVTKEKPLQRNGRGATAVSSNTQNAIKEGVPIQPQITSVKKEDVRHVLDVSAQKTSRPNARYIPAQIRQLVWKRDHGKCTYCGSRFAIQIDHITPIAKNGTHNPSNLRLLCRSCNLSAGIKKFGLKPMKRI